MSSTVQADRVKETTTTTGTGNVTLAGAASGFRTFASVMANNDTCTYVIAGGTEWEVGFGTFVSATPALARTAVLASSNAGALVSFSAGTKDVFIAQTASRLVLPDLSSTPSAPSSSLFLYSKDRFGIAMPSLIGATGVERTLGQDSFFVVRNESGSTINPFVPVYASGTGGSGEPLVAPADADDSTKMPVIGVSAMSIANNTNGICIKSGVLTDINTNSFNVNDTIYVSTTVGVFTATEPTYPAYSQAVARVTAKSATVGAALILDRPMRYNPEQGVHFTTLNPDPAAPAAGEMHLYARPLGGRMVPRFIGPSGLDSAVQPALFGNSVVMWLPGTGTTAAINFGVSWTISATQAHPTIANTNVMTRVKRATYTTTTTAGNAAGIRSAAQVAIRNAGFFFAARWGVLTYTSTMQAWCGLGAASGNIAGDPSAANDSCGMSKDTGETTWQAYTRDGTTTSKTSTGRTTAAAADAEVFDVFMFCKPADTKITFRVVDIATGTVVLSDTEKSSNLPTVGTALYAHCECRNVAGGASSGVGVFLGKMYIEADL